MCEIYVRPELRAKIKKLKRELTYDQFLTQIFEDKEKNSSSHKRTTSNPSHASNTRGITIE